MRRKLILLILVLSCFSCDTEEQSEFTDSPILEAYLHPGEYFMIDISRQTPFSTEVVYSEDDINNLSLQVEHNGEFHTLIALGDGKYIDSTIVVAEGDSYGLSFQFNSKTVTGYTYIPAKPTNAIQSATELSVDRIDSGTFGPPTSMPDPIEITWDNPDHSYYLILVENIESTLDPIRDFGDDGPPSNIFRKQPTSLGTEEIRSMEFQYFGTHRVVIYHVLPDYAALYVDNSSSSQNLTNPSTSIVNGYGIFTGMNSDTLWIEVKEN
jgi:hypothetical protein